MGNRLFKSLAGSESETSGNRIGTSDDPHGAIPFYRFLGHHDNPPDISNDLQNKDRNTVGITTARSGRPAQTPIVISEADKYMIGNRINFLIYVSTRGY